MKIIESFLNGVKLLEPTVYSDERGFFLESYSKKKFLELGIDYDFVQDNQSLSIKVGVLRGLHYQKPPMAQTKLIRVISGEIYDVVVDIRIDSPTFGKWESFILNAKNKRQLLVPTGFAHGFCTTLPNTEVVYKVDKYYSAEHDKGLCWNDSELSIPWPALSPILSEKDQSHPTLSIIKSEGFDWRV